MLNVAHQPAARPVRPGCCPKGAESSPGFTLMELLVSFSLIGLVAVFIHLGYSIGLSAREKAEASLEAYQAAPGLPGRPQPPDRLHGPLRLQPGAPGQAGAGPALSGLPPKPGLRDHLVGPPRASPGGCGSCSTLRPTPTPTPTPTPGADPEPRAAGRRLLLNERPLPPEAGLRGPVIRGVTETEDNRFLADLARPRAGPRSLTLARGSGFGSLPEAGPAARGELSARLQDRSAPFQAPLPAEPPAPTAGRNPAQPALERPGSLGLEGLCPGRARGGPLRASRR